MPQLLFAVAIAEEPVVADAVEPAREDMKQESPDEFLGREGHGLLLIVVAIVSPVEFHMTTFDIDDPMIGDGDPVRVAADVIHHLLWSGEGRFSVNNPFQISHWLQMTVESLRVL